MYDKKAYDRRYDKNNYHHVNLVLPKRHRELISRAAEQCGMSKNAFIRDAVEKRLIELGIEL